MYGGLFRYTESYQKCWKFDNFDYLVKDSPLDLDKGLYLSTGVNWAEGKEAKFVYKHQSSFASWLDQCTRQSCAKIFTQSHFPLIVHTY